MALQGLFSSPTIATARVNHTQCTPGAKRISKRHYRALLKPSLDELIRSWRRATWSTAQGQTIRSVTALRSRYDSSAAQANRILPSTGKTRRHGDIGRQWERGKRWNGIRVPAKPPEHPGPRTRRAACLSVGTRILVCVVAAVMEARQPERHSSTL